jgi:ABC-type Zn uptake system ZnuABC Zn-binding protein ZnuA
VAGFLSMFSNARSVNARSLRTIFSLLALAAITSCTAANDPGSTPHAKTLQVVATSSVLASIVSSIGGDHVLVNSLVPTGASAETYEPTPHDIGLLQDARLLVENGAGYETWISKVISSAANSHLHTTVLSLGVVIIDDNPHLWMDPARGEVYARRIRNALVMADPSHAKYYVKNYSAYDRSLILLQRKIAKAVHTIPKNRRVLLLAHDSLPYYAHRFGFRILGVVETAPGREPSAAHLAALVRSGQAHHVHAVFGEAGESPRLAHALADALPGGNVVTLYVDSLAPDEGISDYRDLLWYDTEQIVNALKAAPAAVATSQSTTAPKKHHHFPHVVVEPPRIPNILPDDPATIPQDHPGDPDEGSAVAKPHAHVHVVPLDEATPDRILTPKPASENEDLQ